MEIEKIIKLRDYCNKNNIKYSQLDFENFLIQGFMYDGIFKTFRETVTKQYRINALEKNEILVKEIFNIENNINIFIQKIILGSKKIDKLELLTSVFASLDSFFPDTNKEIAPFFNYITDEGQALEMLIQSLYLSLTHEVFDSSKKEKCLNHTKSYVVFNAGLKILNFPPITAYFLDRKRYLRSMDNFTSFKKEILLTIKSEIVKNIAKAKFSADIIPLYSEGKQLNKKPGYTWHEEEKDGKLYLCQVKSKIYDIFDKHSEDKTVKNKVMKTK